ncbi:MAG: peptidoglycan-associated lipoprotein Pal [Geminicoccaceae bacterium]|nr:peptidoglycan-associated lipoprotein Pal [Geminicoccaceae bacterium]MCB2011407.1 peptidoglycan-associated lipoprotein Pal [Geminicoccaceae bacterium]
MLKKFAALFAVLFLVAACSGAEEGDIITGTSGAGSTGAGAGSGADAAGGGAGGLRDSDLTSSDLAAGAPSPGTVEDFEVNVGDRVFFDVDSSSLNDEARSILDRQAAWLLQYPAVTITIEGHCDESGTREYNLALGERRASAAKSYLVALGVDTARILTFSYGEERPVDPEHTPQAYAMNRRAVTVVNLVN